MSHSRKSIQASAKQFAELVDIATNFPTDTDKLDEARWAIKATSQEAIDLLFTHYNIVQALSDAGNSKVQHEIMLSLIKKSSKPLHHSPRDLALMSEFPAWIFSKYIKKLSKPKFAQTLSTRSDDDLWLFTKNQPFNLDLMLASVEDGALRSTLIKKMASLTGGDNTFEELSRSTNKLLQGTNLSVSGPQGLWRNNVEAKRNTFLWAQPSPDLKYDKINKKADNASIDDGPISAALKF